MSEGYNNNTGVSKPLTDAQAERNSQQAMNDAAKQIVGATQIEFDKDGKGHVLGMEVSKDMAPAVNYVLSLAPTYLTKFLKDGTYDSSVKLAQFANKKIESLNLDETKFGLRSSLAVMGLLIGFQPLMEFVHGVGKSSKAKAHIREQMADVIASSEGNWKENEVIKTALDRSDSLFWDGLKSAAAMLPTVFVNGMYARENYKELVDKHSPSVGGSYGVTFTHSSAEAAWEAEQSLQRKRQEFIDGKLKKNPKADAEEFGKFFDRHEKQKASDAKAERLAKISSSQNQAPENADNKLIALNLAGFGNVALGSLLKNSGDEKKPCAYKMIVELQRKFENGDISKNSNLSKTIVDIIQQNEVDRGRIKLGDVLVEKLKPLAERVSEVITNGEIEPQALIDLVGNGKIVKNRVFTTEDKLELVLDDERREFGTGAKTSYDEFVANLENPDKMMDIIKENLKNLSGDEKALFANVLSDDVLLHAGIGKKEIQPLREQGHDLVYDFTIKRTQELAQHKPEELKEKYNFTGDQIKGILNLNGLIEHGKQEEVKSVIDSGKLTSSVMTSVLQDMEKNDASWVEKVGKPSDKKLLSEIKPKVHKEHAKEAANDESYAEREEGRKKANHNKHDDDYRGASF